MPTVIGEVPSGLSEEAASDHYPYAYPYGPPYAAPYPPPGYYPPGSAYPGCVRVWVPGYYDPYGNWVFGYYRYEYW